jgi:CBS domain-containing protein
MNAPVAELMSWTSLTIRPDCPATDALAILAAADAETLFVVDADDRFLGVVTGYELLKAELNGSLADCTAAQLLHATPYTLTPEQPVAEAVKRFRESGISTAPVVRDGRLLGALDRKTVLRWLASQRSESSPPIAPPKYLQRTGGTTQRSPVTP